MSPSSTNSARVKQLLGLALMFACVLSIEASAQSTSQKQEPNNTSWQELVSAEGHFRVLMPDIADEQYVPVVGQIVSTEVHVYLVHTPVASYAVTLSDFPDVPSDASKEIVSEGFDKGRDNMLAYGKLRLISEKDISTSKLPAREYVVVDDGAHMMKNKVYYSKGRLYQVMFLSPQLDGMSAEMVQFYDALSSKFFNSFKIGS